MSLRVMHADVVPLQGIRVNKLLMMARLAALALVCSAVPLYAATTPPAGAAASAGSPPGTKASIAASMSRYAR